MVDPHLPRKIATCTSARELDALVAAFRERGETFPAECRGDVLRRQVELERTRHHGAKR
jgi:hypothetical protein